MKLANIDAALERSNALLRHYKTLQGHGNSREEFLRKELEEAQKRYDQLMKDIADAPSQITRLEKLIGALQQQRVAHTRPLYDNVDYRSDDEKAKDKALRSISAMEEELAKLTPEQRQALKEALGA